MSATPNGIHAAVLHAQREAAKVGLAKNKKASLGGAIVGYRGIEEAMNLMCVILLEAGITIEPEYSDLTLSERAKAEVGKATRFATVKGRFTFRHDDGSSQVATAFGEAMDSGDKATVKAQSVALRIALFNKFLIPTSATSLDPEDDDSPDDDDDSPINGTPQPAADPPQQPEKILPDYTAEKFTANFPSWEAAIKGGQSTADRIIAMVSTKGRLNATQQAKIRAVKVN